MNTAGIFTIPEANLSILGIIERCFVFSRTLSNISNNEGSIVTHPITPNITPFAITIPRSTPSVKLMKHIARNPATVVIELPITDVNVAFTACAMARSLSPS